MSVKLVRQLCPSKIVAIFLAGAIICTKIVLGIKAQQLITQIPFDASGKPEQVLRRDLFHNTKVGLFRDFIGSAVLLLISLGYFHIREPGFSNARPICLERAHRHFYLFCVSTGGKAALRSFTPVFFNAKKATDFGWINAKGSDATLLVKWVAVLAKGFINDPLTPDHLPTLNHIYLAAVCARTWQRTLYGHGLWLPQLPRHCCMCVYQEFHEFLKHYNALAYLCLTEHRFTGFAIKSKFHMVAHTKHELGVLLVMIRPSNFYPILWSFQEKWMKTWLEKLPGYLAEQTAGCSWKGLFNCTLWNVRQYIAGSGRKMLGLARGPPWQLAPTWPWE